MSSTSTLGTVCHPLYSFAHTCHVIPSSGRMFVYRYSSSMCLLHLNVVCRLRAGLSVGVAGCWSSVVVVSSYLSIFLLDRSSLLLSCLSLRIIRLRSVLSLLMLCPLACLVSRMLSIVGGMMGFVNGMLKAVALSRVGV